MVYSQISDITSLSLSPLLTLVRLSDPEGQPRGLSRTNISPEHPVNRACLLGRRSARAHTVHLFLTTSRVLWCYSAVIHCHKDVDIFICRVLRVVLFDGLLTTYGDIKTYTTARKQGKMKILRISANRVHVYFYLFQITHWDPI